LGEAKRKVVTNLSAKTGKPRRNMYAFFYATLASMTTIWYSTLPFQLCQLTDCTGHHAFCTVDG
jgi:hypothetical protein